MSSTVVWLPWLPPVNAEHRADNERFGAALTVGLVLPGEPEEQLVVGVPGELNSTAHEGGVEIFRNGSGHLTAHSNHGRDALFSIAFDSALPKLWANTASFGASVAVGNYNGHATAEIAVGAPTETRNKATLSGGVFVLSGDEGRQFPFFKTINGYQNIDQVTNKYGAMTFFNE